MKRYGKLFPLLKNGRQRCDQESSTKSRRFRYIDFGGFNAQIVRPLRELLPRRLETLARWAPWGKAGM